MFRGRRKLAQTFRVSPDALWQALPVSLPCVTQQATWYEGARRVEWVVDSTGISWAQVMSAVVEAATDGTAVLRFTGKSPYRPAIGDSGRRRRVFETLVTAISDALDHPLTFRPELHDHDEFRWWNGSEWTVDPPPMPLA